MCNYNIAKIPAKLSAFHKQILLSWSLIYKHNFSPHHYFIWNYRDMLYKHKSLLYKNWFDNSINLVNQLYNREHRLISYQDFLFHFKIPVTQGILQLLLVRSPSGTHTLFKGVYEHSSFQLASCDVFESFAGKVCFFINLQK